MCVCFKNIQSLLRSYEILIRSYELVTSIHSHKTIFPQCPSWATVATVVECSSRIVEVASRDEISTKNFFATFC